MVGSFWGNIGEWLGIQNPYSAAGQERAAADKANQFNLAQATAANQFTAQQAQIQRDYETQMSNTAYQRAVADMKAAGVNPILAYEQGGASTPSVSAPSGQSATAVKANIAGVGSHSLLSQLVNVASSAALLVKYLK